MSIKRLLCSLINSKLWYAIYFRHDDKHKAELEDTTNRALQKNDILRKDKL